MRTATGRSGVTLGAVVTALAVLAAVVPTSAVARPDGSRLDGVAVGVLGQWVDTGPCPLRRLGDQLVRCDDLTGNGVRAPLQVPVWTGPPVGSTSHVNAGLR